MESMTTLQNLIGGVWEHTSGELLCDLVNPATEQLVARFPAGSPIDVDRAVASATAAQSEWAAMPLADRIEYLMRWSDAIDEHVDELAELECREMGKPVALGRTFVQGAVQGFRAAARLALDYPFAETVSAPDGSSTTITRSPLGVVAVITPWNFPVTMVLGALAPLLAAGNTVVVKPSERSPLSTVRLLELSPLPAGVLNLVLGDARAGAPLVEHPEIGLVHFTGSVETGRRIGASTGARLVRSVLELGGKDPVVVDADVDPVATAAAVAFGSFVNTGQICTSMERIYVHRKVADAFVDALVAAAETYTCGDGHEETSVLGPLVDRRQRDIVHRHVTDAVERGAKVLTGGTIPDRTGFFYPATVLTDVDDSMLILTEETFGPVAPVVVVDSFEEGIERASPVPVRPGRHRLYRRPRARRGGETHSRRGGLGEPMAGWRAGTDV